MLKKREVVLKIFIFVGLFLLIYMLSYFISYIRYDDRDVVFVRGVLEENAILKNELLELSDVTLTEGIVARVILRDLYGFYDEIILNVGSEDGVIENSAVVNDIGLVGVVSRVDDNRSYVKLLSSNYNISIKVNDTYGNYSNGIVTMIDKYSEVRIGDLVYTSGLDDVTGGIYVGKVIDVNLDENGLGKELKIEYVSNDDLNYVYVVGNLE